MAADCPNCAFWKSERDKAVTHAMTYGPMLATGHWFARPYEATEWRLTTEPPTEENRRWLEYRPA